MSHLHLHLITHAHTQQIPTEDAAGWHLSAAGQIQAQTLARQPLWQRVSLVILSSEPKTRLTVQPVLDRLALPVVVDARFDELRRGGWSTDYTAQVAAAFAQPHRSADGWEPASDALARFLSGIAAIAPPTPHAEIALVGHGLTFSLYRAFLLGLERVNLEDWRTLSFAAVAQVDLMTQTLVADFTPIAGDMPRSG